MNSSSRVSNTVNGLERDTVIRRMLDLEPVELSTWSIGSTTTTSRPVRALLRDKYLQYREVEAGSQAIRLVPERVVTWTATTPDSSS
jgi:hypothetical protein